MILWSRRVFVRDSTDDELMKRQWQSGLQPAESHVLENLSKVRLTNCAETLDFLVSVFGVRKV